LMRRSMSTIYNI